METCIMDSSEVVDADYLSSLPLDVLYEILQKLDRESLSIVSRLNSFYRQLTSTPPLARIRLRKGTLAIFQTSTGHGFRIGRMDDGDRVPMYPYSILHYHVDSQDGKHTSTVEKGTMDAEQECPMRALRFVRSDDFIPDSLLDKVKQSLEKISIERLQINEVLFDASLLDRLLAILHKEKLRSVEISRSNLLLLSSKDWERFLRWAGRTKLCSLLIRGSVTVLVPLLNNQFLETSKSLRSLQIIESNLALQNPQSYATPSTIEHLAALTTFHLLSIVIHLDFLAQLIKLRSERRESGVFIFVASGSIDEIDLAKGLGERFTVQTTLCTPVVVYNTASKMRMDCSQTLSSTDQQRQFYVYFTLAKKRKHSRSVAELIK